MTVGQWSWKWKDCCGGSPPPPGCSPCWTTNVPGIPVYPSRVPTAQDQPPYDYVLVICNSNSIQDDNFEVSLNGRDMGEVPEIGQTNCGSRWWATSTDVYQWLALPKSAFACGTEDFILNSGSTCCNGGSGPRTTISNAQLAAFDDNNFIIFMHNIQNNHHGNGGVISVTRFSNLAQGIFAYNNGFPLQDPANRVCVHTWWTFYTQISGEEIVIDFAQVLGADPQVIL